MLPYNASDMIRAMRQDHGLTVDSEANAPARDARRRGRTSFKRSRVDRWIGVVADHLFR